jgi:fatty acid desaturase (delta-4 desaturase)
MAPRDADNNLRQRKPLVSDDDDAATQTSGEIVTSVKKLSSNQVCIEGIIYDISDFDHPGGESIHIFGGNDVTIQYNMIHPYHTDKHLEKMKRVGKVTDFTSE